MVKIFYDLTNQLIEKELKRLTYKNILA